MNEDFLKQFRKLPDASLVEKINIRLERKARRQAIKRYSVFSALALVFVFSMFILFSSPAQAEVLYSLTKPQVVKCILVSGELEKEIREKGYITISEFESFIETYSTTDCEGDGILTTDPNEILQMDPSGSLSMKDAQTRFASPIVLPTHVPQNFKLNDDVEFFNLPEQPTLVMTWESKESIRRIKLLISHNTIELKDYARTLGEGAIEDIVLNGKPAILLRGTWNIGTQQTDFMMTALMWRYDEDTVYALMSLEQAIPLEELRKVAESIP